MKEFALYWLTVAHRAGKEAWRSMVKKTRQDIVRDVVLYGATFAIGCWLNSLLVRERVMSADNTQDTAVWGAIAFVSFAVLVVLVFLAHLLFITPYRMWREATASADYIHPPVNTAKQPEDASGSEDAAALIKLLLLRDRTRAGSTAEAAPSNLLNANHAATSVDRTGSGWGNQARHWLNGVEDLIRELQPFFPEIELTIKNYDAMSLHEQAGMPMGNDDPFGANTPRRVEFFRFRHSAREYSRIVFEANSRLNNKLALVDGMKAAQAIELWDARHGTQVAALEAGD